MRPIIKSSNFRCNFREEKTEENWSERLLLKVYIIVCYFSLIIFSTIELTSFATRVVRRELCSLLINNIVNLNAFGNNDFLTASSKDLPRVAWISIFSVSVLTHCSLEIPKRVIGKQCRPRSDPTEWASDQGLLFLQSLAIILLGIS